jgi:hypothetical protein
MGRLIQMITWFGELPVMYLRPQGLDNWSCRQETFGDRFVIALFPVTWDTIIGLDFIMPVGLTKEIITSKFKKKSSPNLLQ